MADDDLDYHLIVKCALEEVGFRGVLHEVRDGVELMDFLHRRGRHKNARPPDLIILDLNMPVMDGRSALVKINEDPQLRSIPVAVLTTSSSAEDVEFCKRFTGCSFSIKPATYQEWTKSIQKILRICLPSQ
ncbi:MAG: two-component system response regulator [Deltaproteobacteria bacterium HGW-Deltaproteobacteria-21]|nr:MAG: two-component system response regulator [Deltaproteobacteria bacterium HGW-Deltaproteobacteria-21]